MQNKTRSNHLLNTKILLLGIAISALATENTALSISDTAKTSSNVVELSDIQPDLAQQPNPSISNVHYSALNTVSKIVSHHPYLTTGLSAVVATGILLPILQASLGIFNSSSSDSSSHPLDVVTNSPTMTPSSVNNFTVIENITAAAAIASTLCQFLVTDNHTKTTLFSCFDANRTDLTPANTVCSQDQLAYMQANGTSMCGNLSLRIVSNTSNYTAYPFICSNSSNLCYDPMQKPNTTCTYDAVANTMCDKSYESVTLLTADKQPLRVIRINSTSNLLSIRYNILCVPYYDDPNTVNLGCFDTTQALPLAVVHQLAAKTNSFSRSTYYTQNNGNRLIAYNAVDLILSSVCSAAPCYIDNPMINMLESRYQQNFYSRCNFPSNPCKSPNISTCLIANNTKTAVCYLDPNATETILTPAPIATTRTPITPAPTMAPVATFAANNTIIENITTAIVSSSTLCQLLIADINTGITAYSCFDANRTDLASANTVCSQDQLDYMQANGTSFCGNLSLRSINATSNYTAYPFICSNSSNLCYDPLQKPNTTCTYNSVTNTMCDQSYQAITLLTADKQPLRVIRINSTSNSLTVKYNIVCSVVGLDKTDKFYTSLSCYPTNDVLSSAVASQIAQMQTGTTAWYESFATLSSSLTSRNSFYTYTKTKLLHYTTCNFQPTYTSCDNQYAIVSYSNGPMQNTCYSSPCLTLNISQCVFSPNNFSAFCYV